MRDLSFAPLVVARSTVLQIPSLQTMVRSCPSLLLAHLLRGTSGAMYLIFAGRRSICFLYQVGLDQENLAVVSVAWGCVRRDGGYGLQVVDRHE